MKSLKILLVEDDVFLAKSTAKLIERMSSYQVNFTDDPQVIFESCTAGKVDLVIMDINLPGISWLGEEVSGIDLSRLLKAQAATAHIPIIILTAYAMANERESLMVDSQADEFLTKPIRDYPTLVKKIEQLTTD